VLLATGLVAQGTAWNSAVGGVWLDTAYAKLLAVQRDTGSFPRDFDRDGEASLDATAAVLLAMAMRGDHLTVREEPLRAAARSGIESLRRMQDPDTGRYANSDLATQARVLLAVAEMGGASGVKLLRAEVERGSRYLLDALEAEAEPTTEALAWAGLALATAKRYEALDTEASVQEIAATLAARATATEDALAAAAAVVLGWSGGAIREAEGPDAEQCREWLELVHRGVPARAADGLDPERGFFFAAAYSAAGVFASRRGRLMDAIDAGMREEGEQACTWRDPARGDVLATAWRVLSHLVLRPRRR